ncbi:MAG: hypothetical protein Q4B03_10380 [Lachnospiraceae bacterium]|nr:hypothetical protein [Lachnospiraceae bacterium]
MKNLMKYEIIRMKTQLLLALAAIGLLELGILITMFIGMDHFTAIFSVVLALTFWFLIVGVAVAILVQYSRDVNRKSGYMLFMTPNSYYKIVGSKILTSLVLVIGLILLGILLAALDGFAAAAKYGYLTNLDFAGALRELGFRIDVAAGLRSVGWFVSGFFGWVSIFTPIFFVMTLNKAVFSNWKCRGLISFVLFLILMGLFGFIENQLIGWTAGSFSSSDVVIEGISTAVLAVVCYIGTVKILEKKLAL